MIDRLDLTFHDWLALGEMMGFCSAAVCETHDCLPMTEEEQEEFEEGNDPCVLAVRLYPEGVSAG